MKITWIGHSCFKIEENGYTVITDPYADGYVPGLEPVREKANMVLCSHEHGDHNAVSNITIEDNPVCPFKLTRVESWHDDQEGKLRGNNIIHVLESDSLKLIHFGDIGCQLTEDQVQKLSGADVVLIPVGGFFTVDAGEAARIVKSISPKIVVPMHYQGDGFGFDVIAGVEPFAELFTEVEDLGAASFEVEEYLPGQEKLKVVVLKPQNH